MISIFEYNQIFKYHIDDSIESDLKFPIYITGTEIVDGMHRLIKSAALDIKKIDAIDVTNILQNIKLSNNDSYVGQVYTDDNGDSYGIDKLHKLVKQKNKRPIKVDVTNLVKNNQYPWGDDYLISDVIKAVKQKI